jgi:predicted CXXCH cytochrome family protein
MAIIWSAGAALAAKAPAPKEEVALKNCTTADCHGDVKDHRVVHGPVHVNACDACHKLTSAADHKYELTRTKQELCIFCHQVNVQNDPVVHQPLSNGDCLSCHSPHGGFNRHSLRGKDMLDMCSQCHQDVIGSNKHVHGPVAAGACGTCHHPHSGKNPKLLVEQGRALCMMCHTEMDEQLRKVKFVHEAVKKDCNDCHDAHASPYVMQVKQPPLELCTSCHQPIKDAVTKAAHKHSIVTKDDACLNCHTAHGGNLATLMKNEPIKVCLSCHGEAIKTGEDHTIASVAEVLDPSKAKHGSIEEGQCAGCHNVHGSDVGALLAKPYPPTFYESFDLQNYELCFSCHDKQLVLLPRTEGLTRFRNGDVNLHFLHVNKDKKGRTCRACHNEHVSNHSMLIRESVPFGKWELPINFKPTETGGSCLPGCHQELAYDRKTAAPGMPKEDKK